MTEENATSTGSGVQLRRLCAVPDAEVADSYAHSALVPADTSMVLDSIRGNDRTPAEPQDLDPEDVPSLIRAMRQEFEAAVADVEFRLAQKYELMRRMETGQRDKVYIEDLVDGKHRITGYTVTANSPSVGFIAWASLHVVYMGVDYTITSGNTDKKYTYFTKPASYTPGTNHPLTSSDTFPTLGANDAMIFINNGGVPVSALEASVPSAVMPGSVNSQSLASDVSTVLSTLQSDLDAVQAQADGLQRTYFQNDPPWPTGSASPSGAANNEVGDVWYDSNDGGAFRWSGTAGTPVNTWVRIADTDTSAIAALVDTKITTYVKSTAPTAPAGGFTEGDLWIDTANGNVLKRWTAGAWSTLAVGDAAIAGVGAGKVTGTLAVSNIPTLDVGTKTSGTLTGSRVGTGIAGANIVDGSVVGAKIGTNAISPVKINANFHMLY